MFFIIGNPRSGTSLFRLLLTSHSKVHIPPECGFMLWWHQKYQKWDVDFSKTHLSNFLDDLFAAKKFEFWNLDREALSKEIQRGQPKNYAQLCELIYDFHRNEHSPSATTIGDKNNFHLNHIEDLNQLYPDAKFIHIIRDGRDVATSYIDMSKIDSSSDYRPRLPTHIADIAKEWRKNIQSVMDGFSKLPRIKTLEIRYEDLVTDTEKTLTAICKHLGLEYENGMLEFYTNNQANKLEPDEFMAWKARTRGKIDRSAIGKWKALSDTDIKAFEDITHDILSRYNYELLEIN